ncbi:Glutathione import ATP-binding protein GsiA [Burkholderia cepacia]|nr:Glutathione import ATP-binding protein GsiA [Burkholderia cepacia]
MRGGRVVESGPVERVFGAPSHPYTASLLDALPMLANARAASPLPALA